MLGSIAEIYGEAHALSDKGEVGYLLYRLARLFDGLCSRELRMQARKFDSFAKHVRERLRSISQTRDDRKFADKTYKSLDEYARHLAKLKDLKLKPMEKDRRDIIYKIDTERTELNSHMEQLPELLRVLIDDIIEYYSWHSRYKQRTERRIELFEWETPETKAFTLYKLAWLKNDKELMEKAKRIMQDLLSLNTEAYAIYKGFGKHEELMRHADREAFREINLRDLLPHRFLSMSYEQSLHVGYSTKFDEDGSVVLRIDEVLLDSRRGSNLLKGNAIEVRLSESDFNLHPSNLGKAHATDHFENLYGKRIGVEEIAIRHGSTGKNEYSFLSEILLKNMDQAIQVEKKLDDLSSDYYLIDVLRNSRPCDGFMLVLQNNQVISRPPEMLRPSSELEQYVSSVIGKTLVEDHAKKLDLYFEYNIVLAMLRRMTLMMYKLNRQFLHEIVADARDMANKMS